MTKLWPLPIILIALIVSAPASAVDYCKGIVASHDPPTDWAKLLPSVRRYFRSDDDIQFLGSLQSGEWLIIEATTPRHTDDPPFIFFRGRPKHSRAVWEWEGVGPEAETAAKQANPDMPSRLAECFQWAIGNRY